MKRFLFLFFLTSAFLFISLPIIAMKKEALLKTDIEVVPCEEEFGLFGVDNISFVPYQSDPGEDRRWIDDRSSILIYLDDSPGEMVITDPLGRRTGFDPIIEEEYEEIPNSNYTIYQFVDCETDEIIDDPITELMILRPLEGEYRLEVIGTGNGTYILTIYLYTLDNNRTEEVYENTPIYPGSIHTYNFEFKKK